MNTTDTHLTALWHNMHTRPAITNSRESHGKENRICNVTFQPLTRNKNYYTVQRLILCQNKKKGLRIGGGI